mgnify:CR=1 FL=1
MACWVAIFVIAGHLQTTGHREAIRTAISDYALGADSQDWELLGSVFAEDATTHYGAFRGGADEMPEMAMRALGAELIETNTFGSNRISPMTWFEAGSRMLMLPPSSLVTRIA